MFTKVSVVALFAGIAAAVHAPVGEPSGNPITAPLIEIVPACKPYTIKWTPTTPNTVSILLLRGPSTNVVPLGAPLAEGIANSGSFVWTPASSLEADTTHYGLQLIDDVTGQYQYSTQFGISKADCAVVSSSAVKSSSMTGYPVSTPSSTPTPSSTSCSTSSMVTKVSTSSYVASTGMPYNSTIILPTKSMSVPSSLQTATGTKTGSTTSPTVPVSTGAAAPLRAGLGLAGAIGAMVFML